MTVHTERIEFFAQGLFDCNPDGIIVIDKEYTMLHCNPAFEALYPELMPLIGKKCYETSDIDYVCNSCPATTMFETRKATTAIHYEQPRGGKPGMWFEHSAHPLFSPTGEINSAICFVRVITQQIENENALRRFRLKETINEQDHSFEKNDSIVSSIITEGNVPILFNDLEGKIEFVNTAFMSMTGYSEKELRGTIAIEKIFDPRTTNAPYFQRKSAALHSGEIDQHRQDIILVCKNGEQRWVDYAAFVIKDALGRRTRIIAILLDVTERYQMTHAIEEANEQTQIMLDTTPLGCILLDNAGVVIDCNQAALKLFEIPSKQEFSRRFYELLPEYQPNGKRTIPLIREYTEKIAHCDTIRFEFMYRKLDGSLLPTEVTLIHVKRGDSFIIASYSRDLREIKKHEIIQELDRLRTNTLLELAQMNRQTEREIVDYVIKSAITLTQSKAGYMILLESAKNTLSFRCCISDKSMDCAIKMMDDAGMPHTISPTLIECLTTKKAVINEHLDLLPGNRTYPDGHISIRSHMNVPIISGDTAIGFIGVGNKETSYSETDVKQLTLLAQGIENLLGRKKHAENLEKAKNEAELANRAKSSFLAHMSHEIRTPLNGVIGLSDLLADTPLNEKQREYVQHINASGNALLFLINDILDFSKIEAGKLELDCESFDLETIIGSVLASLAPRAGSKNLELCVSLCRNLPRIFHGDAGRVRQILLNLTGNAVKFTNKGGVRIDVNIELIIDTTLMIRFSVIDTGIGIPESAISHLFKAFSQVDNSSSRAYGGTGLGLAISMQLVRLMKGEIGVSSTEGKGSTFWFNIPFECESDVIQCLDKEECFERKCVYIDGHVCTAFVNRNIDSQNEIKGCSVLIVDDNEVQRESLRIQLQNWELECVTCSSGQEALRIAADRKKKDQPFDLFVIDSTLDDGIGIDWACKLFAQENSDTSQMILLRAISEDFDISQLEENQVELIAKPVLASSMFNAVMNRIFAAQKQRRIDSGIISPTDIDDSRAGFKTSKKKMMDRQSLNLTDRLKSYLAGKVHVLVVEDNRVNQIVVQNILAEAGFTYDIANNGSEACRFVQNNFYDIVLMDCQMPEMDGFEATNLIRSWEQERVKNRVPIIALTANAVKEDIQKCFDADMDAYSSKPTNPRALIHLIEEWYEKSMASR